MDPKKEVKGSNMMKRIYISELNNHIGEIVKIQGWVDVIRDQKFVQFLIIRDNTGTIQVVNERKKNPNLAETISSLTNESTISAFGKVVENPNVKLGQIEILLENLVIESTSEAELPISEETSLNKRLDWRFLDLRKRQNRLIFEIQTAAEFAMREYWMRNNFIEIHSPKLMGTSSESGAELFKLDYFGQTAYLAQSPQFYKQMAICAGFEKVFEIGPVFRANPSFTSRHDTEFTSVDVELAWINSHEDVMSFEENWLHYIFKKIHDTFASEIATEFNVEIILPKTPFPRITMSKARRIVQERGLDLTSQEKGDLNPEGERILSEYIFEKYNHEFVFLTDFPAQARPFYHMRYDDQPTITKSFDLIWKGIEITTGAQREHRYQKLIQQAEESGFSLSPLQFYFDFFMYGCPPHGGYGFGLTRMLMLMLNLSNVREVTYIYRGPNRLNP